MQRAEWESQKRKRSRFQSELTFLNSICIVIMKRNQFIRKGLMALAGLGLASKVKASSQVTNHQASEVVGFNHLPNKKIENKMKYVLHKANTRGHAHHGWLDSYHSFSFANYYNPERMNFGVLRVLNDDTVAASMGFRLHPHDNMEIISIPLEGDLEHKDSMGNVAVIHDGDIQVMSAGTGVKHSEFNRNKDKEVRFLQIWMFPNKRDVEPRYDQLKINATSKQDEWKQILSPNAEDDGVWVHQDAWFHMGEFTQEKSIDYQLKKPANNGLYVFVIEGGCTINQQELERRDGFGLWETECVSFQVQKGSKILLMEVPMQLS